MAKKFVWLNIQTGEFSNSWNESEHEQYFSEEALPSEDAGWKLIEYECLNDKTFMFNQLMRIK